MDKCPCCGYTEELGRKADAVMAETAKRNALWRKREDKRIKSGVPVGDCDSCVSENTTCSYSCVAI